MPQRKPAPGLDEYARKRDLKRSAEPPPERKPAGEGPLRFVVHKHAASRLHYDLRLEAEGVLKSWAVPKGPSLDPKEKRLAVMVEDHPADYADFEGVIPEGEYGAGEVIVWDRGSYAPEEDGHRAFDRRQAERLVERGLADGKLSVYLNGEKLKGSFALVKSRRGPKDWLLIKHHNGAASDRDILSEGRSVVSGLTIEDLKAGGRPQKPSGRRPDAPGSPSSLPGARKAAFPRALTPMLATLAKEPFSHPDWLFEPKLDGLRALAFLRDGNVRLVSRRGLDDTKGYPSLAAELAEQPSRELVIDGEIIAPDEQGRPSFQRLQQRMNLQNEHDIRLAEAQLPVLYYVFDILYLDGYDLTGAPFEARRRLLERALASSDRVRLIEQFEQDGETAYRVAVDHGLEGVMAKKRDSVYAPGQRSRAWLKVKGTLSDEFVVGGYTRGAGVRARTFGSLVLGQYDERHKLRYVGNVGSGFDDRLLDDILARLEKLRAARSPFAGPVDRPGDTTWVKPQLVAEVKFAQWTGDGKLRAPVFLRLRDDKPKGQVARVEVVETPSGATRPDPSPAASVSKRDVDAVVDQISSAKRDFTLKLQGHDIPLNNLDKPFWPPLGKQRALTKRDLLVYLARVSPFLLPHLRDRPLTLKRYPNGIDGESFFQKHYDNGAPPFVEKVLLFSEQEGDQQYLLCNNLPTLLWLGQIADIELHTWYSRTSPEPDATGLTTAFSGSLDNILGSALNYPDFIVFDLDPYLYSGEEKEGDEPALNRKAFARTREVAVWLHEVLDSLSLPAFVKTSGRTGLHVYVPIVRRFTFDEVRAAAGSIGRYLMQQHPDDITMDWAVSKRKGKVFFDHNQNSRGKTLASAYSPRPSPEASVSIPLLWEELPHIYPTDFTILNVADRLAQNRDPWQGILSAKHDLSALLSKGPEAAAR